MVGTIRLRSVTEGNTSSFRSDSSAPSVAQTLDYKCLHPVHDQFEEPEPDCTSNGDGTIFYQSHVRQREGPVPRSGPYVYHYAATTLPESMVACRDHTIATVKFSMQSATTSDLDSTAALCFKSREGQRPFNASDPSADCKSLFLLAPGWTEGCMVEKITAGYLDPDGDFFPALGPGEPAGLSGL
ncbi:hypothetical protein I317_05434 [Kwoniella heveanensis CBS 569]|nr:hypothetical protein I317_05434 [Kwoniella heveanensis CBS 569]